MTRQPLVVVIGGHNGAGKTTASRMLLAGSLKLMTFVNVDVIAQGIGGFDPDSVAFEAGRLMLKRLDELSAARHDFALETTLASRSLAARLRLWKDAGYRVELYYYWLQSADLAVLRVAQRVQQGGHHVDEEVIRRRYSRSVHNFLKTYVPLADHWRAYDNTYVGQSRLIAEGDDGGRTIVDSAAWQTLEKVLA